MSMPSSAGKGGKPSERLDVALDLSIVVLSTLKNAAKLSPIAGIAESAGLAIQIIDIVQKARGNKDGFKALAVDSAELVYAIVHSQKEKIGRQEGLPPNLVENLEQLVGTLKSIVAFAQKGASRGFFKAMLRAGVDAGQILAYREKLQQSMRVFGLQSDMDIRDTVHKIAKDQEKLATKLQNKNGPTGPVNSKEVIALRAMEGGSGPFKLANSVRGNVQIETTSGDKISNNVSNTISNNASNNVLNNSTFSIGNSTTTYANTYHN